VVVMVPGYANEDTSGTPRDPVWAIAALESSAIQLSNRV